MASAADSLASGLNLSKFAQATDLKKRLWFTIGALIVFRLLSYVPLPGVDPTALGVLSNQTNGGVLDFFNNFSGGSLKRMSLTALGVMPYITASIVVQLATSLSPTLAAIKKEGESGRKRLNQYTRYGTVALTAVQGWFIAVGLEAYGANSGIQAVVEPGMLFRVGAVISLIGGTMFLMWLGEQITSRGIGNGVSLIIMAGIVANMPTNIYNLVNGSRTGSMDSFQVIGIIVAVVAIILFICFMERAQRRILIQYPKRQTQRGVQSDRSHLPLKLNTAGVIPPIFASSLLLMPLTITQLAGNKVKGDTWWGDVVIGLNQYLQHGSLLYMTLYGLGIIFFSFFYTAVTFQPVDVAENLKKQQANIPGIRPGKQTAEYIDRVLTRLTVAGSIYVATICVIPSVVALSLRVPFQFGGTSLMIVVGVALETVNQIEAHLITRSYEGLTGPRMTRLSGRRTT